MKLLVSQNWYPKVIAVLCTDLFESNRSYKFSFVSEVIYVYFDSVFNLVRSVIG